jgi:predicted MFS family arabinose efflux permease
MTDQPAISEPMPPIIYAMTVAAGLGAANLHYSQPLLPSMAESFGVSVSSIGFLPALTQLGFALGIILVLPLADLLERRSLIVTLLCLVAAALFLHSMAPSPDVLLLAGFLVGLTGVVPQLLTPFASILAPHGRTGAAVGLVLTGVLTGVLLSKVFAGFITQGLGWRDLYKIATVLMIALAFVLWLALPKSRSDNKLSYGALLNSTWMLARSESRLRRHALNGGLTFAAFMTFWATYAVYLHEQFGYGPAIAGLFGVAGFAGAIAASFAGRAIDRGEYRATLLFAGGLMMMGFVLLFWSGVTPVFMVVGLLLLDAGAGISHSANQTKAFAIDPAARGRINSVYMFGYFIGGSLGTLAATFALEWGGWLVACLLGFVLASIMVALELFLPIDRPISVN